MAKCEPLWLDGNVCACWILLSWHRFETWLRGVIFFLFFYFFWQLVGNMCLNINSQHWISNILYHFHKQQVFFGYLAAHIFHVCLISAGHQSRGDLGKMADNIVKRPSCGEFLTQYWGLINSCQTNTWYTWKHRPWNVNKIMYRCMMTVLDSPYILMIPCLT